MLPPRVEWGAERRTKLEEKDALDGERRMGEEMEPALASPMEGDEGRTKAAGEGVDMLSAQIANPAYQAFVLALAPKRLAPNAIGRVSRACINTCFRAIARLELLSPGYCFGATVY